MPSRLRLPALLLALVAGVSSAGVAQTVATNSDSTLVLGVLDGWGIIRPYIARTDTGWAMLRSEEDYKALMTLDVRRRQEPASPAYGALLWRLLPRDGPAREVRSGHIVMFDDPYFGAWGLLTDQTPTHVRTIIGAPILGAIVPPWAPAVQGVALDLDAPEVDSINAHIAPSTVYFALAFEGPGRSRWIYYRGSWTPPGRPTCSLAEAEGWIRDEEFDSPQRDWIGGGLCEGGKGDTWATPLALIDEPGDDLVIVLLSGWEYEALGVRVLSTDSIGPVLPRGW